MHCTREPQRGRRGHPYFVLYQSLLPKKDRVERFHLFFVITTAKTTLADCKQSASRNIL